MSDTQENNTTPDENKVQDVENVVENVPDVGQTIDEHKNESTHASGNFPDQTKTLDNVEILQGDSQENETPEAKKTSRSVSFSEVVAENETSEKETEPAVKIVPLTTKFC